MNNIPSKDRKFLFYHTDEAFRRDINYLSSSPLKPIVFIEDTKTIWTHGVRFSCKDLTNAIQDMQDDLSTSISNIDSRLNETINNLITESNNAHAEALELFRDDLQSAKDKLDNAQDRIAELENSTSEKEYIQHLEGLIRTLNSTMGGYNTVISEFTQRINVLEGQMSTIGESLDVDGKINTKYTQIVNWLQGYVDQRIATIDVGEDVETIVGRIMNSQTGMLKDYVTRTELQDDDSYLQSLAERLMQIGTDGQVSLTDLTSFKDSSSTLGTLLSALNMTVGPNGASWSLLSLLQREPNSTEWGDYDNNPILAAIYGWVSSETGQSEIKVKADHIIFEGDDATFKTEVVNLLDGQYADKQGTEESINDLNSDIAGLRDSIAGLTGNYTQLSNRGITIASGNDRIQLLKNETGEFSGLAHWVESNPNSEEGAYSDRYDEDVPQEKWNSSFALSIDGSGHLGKGKNYLIDGNNESHFPIEWDTNGKVSIYGLTGGGIDIYDNSGNTVDLLKLGLQTIMAFAYGLEDIAPIKPGNNQWFDNNDNIIVEDSVNNVTYTWSRTVTTTTDKTKCLWMTTRVVDMDNNFIQGKVWEGPYRISGPGGQPGEDSDGINFVYRHSKSGDTSAGGTAYGGDSYYYAPRPEDKPESDTNLNGWVQNASDQDASLTELYPYVWVSISTTKDLNGHYINYSNPILWAHWGHDGNDGDGVEYIYYVSNGEIDWDNLSNNDINPQNWNRSDTAPYNLTGTGWYLDPLKLTSGCVEYVSQRKKTNNEWGYFSKPAEWARYSKDGVVSGYYSHIANQSMPVVVDEEGKVVDYIFTGYASYLVFKNGVEISNDPDNGGEYFEIAVDASKSYIVGPAQAPSNKSPWLETSIGEFNNNTFATSQDTTGHIIQVVINDMDDTNTDLTSPIQFEDLTHKQIYIPVVATIYDSTDTLVGRIEDTITVYGIYTGADGESGSSIELVVSTDVIGSSKDGSTLSQSFFDAYTRIVKGSNTPSIKEPSNPNFKIDVSFGEPNGNTVGTYDSNALENNKWLNINNRRVLIDPSVYFPIFVRLRYVDGGNQYIIDDATISRVYDGEDGVGRPGQGCIKSVIFTRINETPGTPVGGNYSTPQPTGDNAYVTVRGLLTNKTWTDGIPDGEEQLWASTRIFTSDGLSPLQSVWSTPRIMTDSSTYDVEFAKEQHGGGVPDKPDGTNRNGGTGQQIWYDPVLDSNEDFTKMVWRAERIIRNGEPGDWVILRIKGETGPGLVSLHLDNPVDIIPADNDGEVIREVTLSTGVTLFDGDLPVQSGVTITAEDITLSSGTTISPNDDVPLSYSPGMKITWTINGGEEILNNGEKYNSTISAVYNGITYEAVFTATVLCSGEDGELPTTYLLYPERSDLIFDTNRDGAGNVTYAPVIDTVAVKIEKTSNSGKQLQFLSNGFTIKYGYTKQDLGLPTSVTQGCIKKSGDIITNTTESGVDEYITVDTDTYHEFTLDANHVDDTYDLWFELYDTLDVDLADWIDRCNVFVHRRALDGIDAASARLDVDNEMDAVLCGGDLIVASDTTIVSNARLYKLEGTVELNSNNFLVDPLLVTRGVETVNAITTEFADDGSYATITIDLRAGDVLSSEKQLVYIQATDTNNIMYNNTISIIAVTSATIYQLNPSESSIVFDPNDDSNTECSISCNCKVISANDTHTSEWYNIKDSYSIYYVFDDSATVTLYGTTDNVTPQISISKYTPTNTQRKYIQFFLLPVGHDSGNTTYTVGYLTDNAIDIETVPILYHGKDGEGLPGKDAIDFHYDKDTLSLTYDEFDNRLSASPISTSPVFKQGETDVDLSEVSFGLLDNTLAYGNWDLGFYGINDTTNPSDATVSAALESRDGVIKLNDIDKNIDGHITVQAWYNSSQYISTVNLIRNTVNYDLIITYPENQNLTINTTDPSNPVFEGGQTESRVYIRIKNRDTGDILDASQISSRGLYIKYYINGTGDVCTINNNRFECTFEADTDGITNGIVYKLCKDYQSGSTEITIEHENTNWRVDIPTKTNGSTPEPIDVIQYRWNWERCYATCKHEGDGYITTLDMNGSFDKIVNNGTPTSISPYINLLHDEWDNNTGEKYLVGVKRSDWNYYHAIKEGLWPDGYFTNKDTTEPITQFVFICTTVGNTSRTNADGTTFDFDHKTYEDYNFTVSDEAGILGEPYVLNVNMIPKDGVTTIETITQPGEPGYTFYLAGQYDNSKDGGYNINNYLVPIVYFAADDEEHTGFYRLVADSNIQNSTIYAPYRIDYNRNTYLTSNGIWEKLDDFDVVLTKAIFADYAKFGSSIMYGDYMYSAKGKYYGNGSTTTINGKPVSTAFDPNLITKEIVTVNGNNNSSGTDSYIKVAGPFNIVLNCKYKFYIKYKIQSSLNGTLETKLAIGDSDWQYQCGFGNINHNFENAGLYTEAEDEITFDTSDSSHYDTLKNITNDGFYLYAYNHNQQSVIKVTELRIEVIDGFIPNYCVDLYTGTIWAAGGNFIVNADGSIIAGDGNFTVNPDGSIIAAGGNFTVNLSGDISFKGTICGVKNEYVVQKYNPSDLKNSSVVIDKDTDYYIHFSDYTPAENTTILLPKVEDSLNKTITIMNPQNKSFIIGINDGENMNDTSKLIGYYCNYASGTYAVGSSHNDKRIVFWCDSSVEKWTVLELIN